MVSVCPNLRDLFARIFEDLETQELKAVLNVAFKPPLTIEPPAA